MGQIISKKHALRLVRQGKAQHEGFLRPDSCGIVMGMISRIKGRVTKNCDTRERVIDHYID